MAIRIDNVFSLVLAADQDGTYRSLFAQVPTKAAIVATMTNEPEPMKLVACLLPAMLEEGQHDISVAGVKVGTYTVAAVPIVRETHIRKPKEA